MKKRIVLNRIKLILCVLFLYIFVFVNQFAYAKYVKSSENIVTLTFKKAVIEESEIICTPNLDQKGIDVEITTQTTGQIKYKLEEDSTWKDYYGKFIVDKNTTLHTKISFSDGDGPETKQKIELQYYSEQNGENNIIFYKNLNDAINNSTNVVKPLYDENIIEEKVTVQAGKDVTLDLDGKNMTFINANITNNGNLTITGAGKITTDSETDLIVNSGILNLQHTGIISNTNKTKIETNIDNAINTIKNENGGAVNITGTGTIHSDTTGAVIKDGTINMSSGIVETTGGKGIYSSGNFTMTGGTISSSNSNAVQISGDNVIVSGDDTIIQKSGTVTGAAFQYDGVGTATLSSGTIKTLEDSSSSAIYNGNSGAIIVDGANIEQLGDGLSAVNSKEGTIRIVSGKVISANQYGINNKANGKIEVVGGEIAGKTGGICNQSSGNIEITGGNISSSEGIGIIGNTGVVNISGLSTKITGATYGLEMKKGTATIKEGFIEATNGIGVKVSNNGVLIIGNKEISTQEVNIISPQIKGTDIGVNVDGTFNYYGGIIIGSAGKSIEGIIAEKSYSYIIQKTAINDTEEQTILIPTGILDIGKNINIKMKTLAQDIDPTESSQNTTITQIKYLKNEAYITDEYKVSISDSVLPIYMWYENGVIYWWCDNPKILLNSDSSYIFSGLSSLSELDTQVFDTSLVTTMNEMFCMCSSLKSLDLSSWDTEKVTSMKKMFSTTDLNNPLKIESINFGKEFDTRNVTDMAEMFEGCSYLKQLDLSCFNTSKVKNMSYMFNNCTNLVNLNVNNFDTREATNMYNMFCGCENLVDLDLSSFKTNKVTNMAGMFNNCTNLVNLNVNNFDTKEVTNMSFMFGGCKSLVNLDLSSFKTNKVTDMSSMFSGLDFSNAMELTEIKGLENFDTENVENMNFMFSQCHNLTNIDQVSNWNTSKVTDMSAMFQNVPITSLEPLKNWNLSKVENMSGMFDGSLDKPFTTVEPLKAWDVSNVKYMASVFETCSSLINLNGLENWNTSNVITMEQMFMNCKELQDASAIDNWNIEKVLTTKPTEDTNSSATSGFYRMFYNSNVHPTFTTRTGAWDDEGTFSPSQNLSSLLDQVNEFKENNAFSELDNSLNNLDIINMIIPTEKNESKKNDNIEEIESSQI